MMDKWIIQLLWNRNDSPGALRFQFLSRMRLRSCRDRISGGKPLFIIHNPHSRKKFNPYHRYVTSQLWELGFVPSAFFAFGFSWMLGYPIIRVQAKHVMEKGVTDMHVATKGSFGSVFVGGITLSSKTEWCTCITYCRLKSLGLQIGLLNWFDFNR